MRAAALVLLAVAQLCFPHAARAQRDSVTLDRVDALVVSGRADDARAALTQWWAVGGRGPMVGARRAELQRGLWLRGVLTVDPAQAALDFQRLVVEFPGGAWTDQALLRLARIADARGERTRAREQLTALLRDYPASAHRAEAERMLAAVEAGAPPPSATAVTSAARARARPAADTAADAAATSAAAPAPTGGWTVQIGAFANPVRARALRDELVAAGIDARLVTVRPSPLLRVRAGRFADEDQAQALRRGLAARGYDATVSADAEREEEAR
jgi:hypothetical protein